MPFDTLVYSWSQVLYYYNHFVIVKSCGVFHDFLNMISCLIYLSELMYGTM